MERFGEKPFNRFYRQ